MISTEPDLYVSIDQAIIANTTNLRWDNNQLRHKIFLLLFHYSYRLIYIKFNKPHFTKKGTNIRNGN